MVSIDENGNITANYAGNAVIEAIPVMENGEALKKTVQVTVSSAPKSI